MPDSRKWSWASTERDALDASWRVDAVSGQRWENLGPDLPASLAAPLDSYRKLPFVAWQARWVDGVSGVQADWFDTELRRIVQVWCLGSASQVKREEEVMLDDLLQAFHRVGLSVAAMAEDPASRTCELAVLIEAGPLRLLGCGNCAYVSRPEVAPVRLRAQSEAALPLERVATPDADTISRLCESSGNPGHADGQGRLPDGERGRWGCSHAHDRAARRPCRQSAESERAVQPALVARGDGRRGCGDRCCAGVRLADRAGLPLGSR